MKIKLKSTVQQAKTFDYVLHILQVTEANILDYLEIKHLFSCTDWHTCEWEELMLDVGSKGVAIFRNIEKDSFNIEIEDFDNNLDLLQQFLTDNDLNHEIQ